jgi:uroporphyrinogen decarboxylase
VAAAAPSPARERARIFYHNCGSSQLVTWEVRRRIVDLAPGGGFIFNPVHNIQPLLPPENIAVMFATAQKYWKYP